MSSPERTAADGSPAPLRVGYVLKRYPRFSETFVVHEILAHERAGLEIEIFALGPVAESHFQEGISRVRAPVTRLPERCRQGLQMWAWVDLARRRLPGFWAAVGRIAPGDADEVAQAIQLALAVQERGLDHLHAHFGTQATTVARMAAAFAGIGYSFTAHAKDIYFEYEQPVGMGEKLQDAAFALTVSDYNLAHLRRQHGEQADRLLRLYNGLDLGHLPFVPRSAEGPAGHPAATGTARPTLLAVGRLVEKKGLRVLVEAARVLAGRGVDFDGRIIGDGPLRAELQAQIEQSGLADRLRLDGPRAQPEVMAAMREAALLCAPCVISDDGDRDGLPTVLLEGMALGVPCVSTAVAGIPELVIDGHTGLCVEPDDPDALADALQRLLTDAALGARLAQAARRHVEAHFDIDVNTARQRQCFVEAVQARPGARSAERPDDADGARGAAPARPAAEGSGPPPARPPAPGWPQAAQQPA